MRERICCLVPHAKLKVTESAGHMLPIERPGDVASDLLCFWDLKNSGVHTGSQLQS